MNRIAFFLAAAAILSGSGKASAQSAAGRSVSPAVATSFAALTFPQTSVRQSPIGFHNQSQWAQRSAASHPGDWDEDDAPPKVGPHLFWGLVLGVVAGAAVSAVAVSKCSDDCMMAGPAIPYIIGLGAAAGGAGGLFVWAIRYGDWKQRH